MRSIQLLQNDRAGISAFPGLKVQQPARHLSYCVELNRFAVDTDGATRAGFNDSWECGDCSACAGWLSGWINNSVFEPGH
jgi:hypothetical protein